QAFGIEPSDAVRALLTAEVVPAPKKPAAPAPAPAPGPAEEVPVPVRLPRPLTRFFGREGEVDRIGETLRPTGPRTAGCRLVTLIGPGGAGKTRTAIEAARRMASGKPPAYPRGVTFVSLADLRDPARLPEAIADALDAPRLPGAASEWERIEAVLPPGEPESAAATAALLVLDNIEHLLPEAAARVASLLERFPALHFVVTSRAALGIRAEREMPLEPLPGPGDGGPAAMTVADLEALQRLPAVALFLDRARSTRPDFALSTRNAGAVAELCRVLEGIPLAIELAAAWTQLLPPARILERILEGERFTLLVSRRRDAPSRHATLRSAISSSYDLLPERARALFDRLAVFRGGWSLEDAEAVCAGDDPLAFLDGLTVLREHWLITVREPEDGGDLRFGMLETLREFAAERLAAAEPDGATALRHAAHFLRVAGDAYPAILGPDPHPALERMTREQGNLRAARERLGREPGRAADALRLTLALAALWHVRGSLAEAWQALHDALSHAGDEASPGLRAEALRLANNVAQTRFDFDAAEADCRAAVELYREAGDEAGYANTLKDLARIALGRADADRARALLEEARPVLERVGDAESLGTLHNAFGMLAMSRNDTVEARPHYLRALELLDGVANPQNVARVRANLGMIFAAEGEATAAREQQELAARELRRAGDRWTLARVLDALGDSLTREGDDAAARPVLEEALALHRELHDWQGALDSHYYLSQLLLERDPEAAEGHLRECVSVARFSPVIRRVAYVLQACGDYAAARGRHEDAALLWAAARRRFESLGIRETGPLTYAQARYQPAVEAAFGPDALSALDARGRALSDAEALDGALPAGEEDYEAAERSQTAIAPGSRFAQA
ncbi:MAG TPA: AAA family ATPase, partial [Armatimonadaceae bacterium]|nr:AAA family ATPase [Armatimonadaceae bacterium]